MGTILSVEEELHLEGFVLLAILLEGLLGADGGVRSSLPEIVLGLQFARLIIGCFIHLLSLFYYIIPIVDDVLRPLPAGRPPGHPPPPRPAALPRSLLPPLLPPLLELGRPQSQPLLPTRHYRLGLPPLYFSHHSALTYIMGHWSKKMQSFIQFRTLGGSLKSNL